MSTLVRSSTAIDPRGESSSFARAWSSRGLRVADRDEAGLERRELELLLLLGELELALLLELRERRHANEVALAHHPEALGLQDDVEHLVPGDVAHADGDRAGDVVGRDDVDVTGVGQEPEDVVDVGVLEIDVDAPAVVALLREHAGIARREARGLAARGLDLRVLVVDRRLDPRQVLGRPPRAPR